jgi:hypothetical protein
VRAAAGGGRSIQLGAEVGEEGEIKKGKRKKKIKDTK